MIHRAFPLLTGLALTLLLAACGPKSSDTGPEDEGAGPTIPADFRDWGSETAEPFVSEGHGGGKYVVKIYGNDLAKASLSARSGPYPVGSIVVKEHWENVAGKPGAAGPVMAMVKRDAGYDPDHGDWEYMVAPDAKRVNASGRMEACIGCHDKAKDRDWIFGAPGEDASGGSEGTE